MMSHDLEDVVWISLFNLSKAYSLYGIYEICQVTSMGQPIVRIPFP